jgi:hypothetical protein
MVEEELNQRREEVRKKEGHKERRTEEGNVEGSNRPIKKKFIK